MVLLMHGKNIRSFRKISRTIQTSGTRGANPMLLRHALNDMAEYLALQAPLDCPKDR